MKTRLLEKLDTTSTVRFDGQTRDLLEVYRETLNECCRLTRLKGDPKFLTDWRKEPLRNVIKNALYEAIAAQNEKNERMTKNAFIAIPAKAGGK